MHTLLYVRMLLYHLLMSCKYAHITVRAYAPLPPAHAMLVCTHYCMCVCSSTTCSCHVSMHTLLYVRMLLYHLLMSCKYAHITVCMCALLCRPLPPAHVSMHTLLYVRMLFYVTFYHLVTWCQCLHTEIPTIRDPSATINYPSATGSIVVGISSLLYVRMLFYMTCRNLGVYGIRNVAFWKMQRPNYKKRKLLNIRDTWT
jgi:hypothetical protein